MTTTEIEPAIEAGGVAPELEPVERSDETLVEHVGEALMAMPVALLCAANTATIIGATAWQAGGAAGLAGTGGALGTTAAAGWVVRRAHQAEARRRAERDGQKPEKKTDAAKPSVATKAKTELGRRTSPTASGPRAALGALSRRNRVARAQRAGGASAGRPTGKTGGLRSLDLPSRAGGAGRKTSSLGGGTGKPSAPGGKLSSSTGGRLGRPSGTGRPGSSGGSGSRLGGLRAASARGASAAGRHTGASRTGKAAGSALSSARKVAGSASGTARRAATGAAGGARKAATNGAAKLGRGTHAAAGSRPGQRIAASGRRIAGAARGGAAAARRTHASGRAAIAGAAKARGQSPKAVARAAKTGIAAAHTAQDQTAGKTPGRAVRLRRLITRNAAGAGAGSAVRATRGARAAGRWGRWGWRAARARWAGRPAPPTPRREAQERRAPKQSDTGHPPVTDSVTEPPATAGGPASTPGAHPMSTLGILLHDLSGQMAAAAATYNPEGMLEWGDDMRCLEGVLDNVAEVLRALEKGAEDLPIEPVVKHTLASVGSLQAACSSAADEIYSTFRAVHEDEISRLENPRPSEHKWDSAANQ